MYDEICPTIHHEILVKKKSQLEIFLFKDMFEENVYLIYIYNL